MQVRVRRGDGVEKAQQFEGGFRVQAAAVGEDVLCLGAELRDHIYQKLLPGQFFTYSGKYYEMLYTTYDGQVLVRRAADHIDGRPSYRQIRKYRITDTKVSEKIFTNKFSIINFLFSF